MADFAQPAGLALYLRSPEPAALRFAIDIGATAVAAGESVVFIVFGDALAAFIAGLNNQRIAEDLTTIRALAQHQGSFEILACSGGVEAARLDPDVLVGAGTFDDVVGLPAIWRKTRSLRLLAV